METELSSPGVSLPLRRRLATWTWWPLGIGVGSLGSWILSAFVPPLALLEWPAMAGVAAAWLYFVVQVVARLVERRWRESVFAFLRLAALVGLTVVALWAMMMLTLFGPSEDHFADNLTIPAGLELAEPETDVADEGGRGGGKIVDDRAAGDFLQGAVRAALAVVGSDVPDVVPQLPSLRRAATDHSREFLEYVEASPDWHVFLEGGNRFAARRWSYWGEPRDTLHGYISEFGGYLGGFQTRCLLCLDRQQWSRYRVQRVAEGSTPVRPEVKRGNNLHESRLMIECGDVWVEIFEQSNALERRVTKATLAALEAEFAAFVKDPESALAAARARSRELAKRLAGDGAHPFRLLTGMQPGIYGVAYALNPGEPGAVYLKAFEVTRGTALSAARLKGASQTRLTWSTNITERFGAKAGFTIDEGDWGMPYAARFEVWFQPDSGQAERKLAERLYKIEGWQR